MIDNDSRNYIKNISGCALCVFLRFIRDF